jgi:hypothetical protein
MRDYITAAVQDAVHAANIPAWDIRHNAIVAKATRALTTLDEAAALRGPVVRANLWAGFFKLSANEPHRLPKLVDSIVMLRLDDVARALLRYNRDND